MKTQLHLWPLHNEKHLTIQVVKYEYTVIGHDFRTKYLLRVFNSRQESKNYGEVISCLKVS